MRQAAGFTSSIVLPDAAWWAFSAPKVISDQGLKAVLRNEVSESAGDAEVVAAVGGADDMAGAESGITT